MRRLFLGLVVAGSALGLLQSPALASHAPNTCHTSIKGPSVAVDHDDERFEFDSGSYGADCQLGDG